MSAQAYQALFKSELYLEDMKTIRVATHWGGLAGSARFRKEITVVLGRKFSPPKKNGHPGADSKATMPTQQSEPGL
jgi:hypothetical protein